MDDHAANWANRLLENPPTTPVLEVLLQGAALTALENVWVAVAGADCGCNVNRWRAVRLREGDTLRFSHNRVGLWAYLAVEGGFDAESSFGSRSTYARGQLGRALAPGDVLSRNAQYSFTLPTGVAGRAMPWSEDRNYAAPPQLRVWPGPQWDLFDPDERDRFFGNEWTITSQSDRVGYRLSGPALQSHGQILSEPVRVGSIQVPENGQPIVTMRDGPTTGGYSKLGLLDLADISWLAQCRPGQKVRFRLHPGEAPIGNW
jgi:biotin-dependent carboxylase-like uncharacterized protein